jgi:hypothetical protein
MRVSVIVLCSSPHRADDAMRGISQLFDPDFRMSRRLRGTLAEDAVSILNLCNVLLNIREKQRD